MKKEIITLVGGLLAGTATYTIIRDGSFVVAAAVVVLLAVVTASIAFRVFSSQDSNAIRLALAFVAGTATSEIGFFAGYYFFNGGMTDPKLWVGVTLVLLEFVGVSIIGVVSIMLVALSARRRTRA